MVDDCILVSSKQTMEDANHKQSHHFRLVANHNSSVVRIALSIIVIHLEGCLMDLLICLVAVVKDTLGVEVPKLLEGASTIGFPESNGIFNPHLLTSPIPPNPHRSSPILTNLLGLRNFEDLPFRGQVAKSGLRLKQQRGRARIQRGAKVHSLREQNLYKFKKKWRT